jgi:uncharacterized surface protein with fasciclin (FAS1) repeats
MKKKNSILIILLLFVSGGYYACQEQVSEDAFYTFTGNTVASFCKEDEDLSVFYQLIEEADYAPLLSLYGHYTVFAPTNAGFEAYFKELGITYDDLSKEDKIILVNDHVVKDQSKDYISELFQEGALPTPNMNSRFLVISYTLDSEGKQVILVNKESAIQIKDNEVHNGVVHIVNKVVKPSQENLLSILKEAGNFKLFAEAFELTNLVDSISELYDYAYKDPAPGTDRVNVAGRGDFYVSHQKKLGYTIFAETDEVLEKAGITTLEQLIAFAKNVYGTQDLSDYTNRNNPLNKFISYHILDRQMSTNSFLYTGPSTAEYAMDKRCEYYETMLKMRLMEIKAGNKINTLKDGSFVGIDELLSNLDGVNGYVHALTNLLVYDEDKMISDVLNKRIRFDAYAVSPELTNNNIRWNVYDRAMTITPDFCGEHFTFNEAAKPIMWALEGWDAHQADEIVMMGWYDFTLRLLPIPPGTYEIRFGYNAVDWRGIAQLFIDGQICGIPVDLKTNGFDPSVGWVKDSETQDDGVENDKMMRNRGYMKSGKAIKNGSPSYGHTLRDAQNDLRVIVGTFTFQEYGYHYFRAKNVESENNEFQLDFFEYVPVNYLDREDRD